MFSPPLLALGFRPFFLVAGVFATLWVPLWLAVWRGLLPVPSYFGPIGWDRHEMLFGYALGVIAGFPMNAAGKWGGGAPETKIRRAAGGCWRWGRSGPCRGWGCPFPPWCRPPSPWRSRRWT